jgi:hypothetical protein
MRVLGIIGILITILIIALIATKEFTSFGKGTNPKQTVNNAAAVKNNANLSALATKLNIYFAENGRYPDNLSQVDSYGLDLNAFEYEICNQTKVVIKSGSSSLILNNGSSSPNGGC